MSDRKNNYSCWSSSKELRNKIFICLQQLGVTPSKNKGQHYLVDANIINYIIEKANISEKDTVLEIGGGPGTLTKCLSLKAKKVFTIESDRVFAKYLEDYFASYNNVEVIYGDAIKIEWPRFNKCVSNLPYQISSPFTFKLLKTPFDYAIVMYQKEFADRMIAKAGTKNYSRLSLMMYLQSNLQYLKTVPEQSFFPRPKIKSSIIYLEPITQNYNINFEIFAKFATLLFTMKGKTVGAVIKHKIRRVKSELDSESIDKIESLPYLSDRIFKLEPMQVVSLFKAVVKVLGEEFVDRIL